MRRVHVSVTGTVQGVGYRYTLQHVAQRAGVTGWASDRSSTDTWPLVSSTAYFTSFRLVTPWPRSSSISSSTVMRLWRMARCWSLPQRTTMAGSPQIRDRNRPLRKLI